MEADGFIMVKSKHFILTAFNNHWDESDNHHLSIQPCDIVLKVFILLHTSDQCVFDFCSHAVKQ